MTRWGAIGIAAALGSAVVASVVPIAGVDVARADPWWRRGAPPPPDRDGGDRDGRGGRGDYRSRDRSDDGRDGRGYYRHGDGYYRRGPGGPPPPDARHRRRCRDRGTGGTIIGAIAGGLLGDAVAGRGDRTIGAILGAGGGALAGRAIDRDCGPR